MTTKSRIAMATMVAAAAAMGPTSMGGYGAGRGQTDSYEQNQKERRARPNRGAGIARCGTSSMSTVEGTRVPADVTFTKPEMRLLLRLTRRQWVQATGNSDRLRAAVVLKLSAALGLTPGIEPGPIAEGEG